MSYIVLETVPQESLPTKPKGVDFNFNTSGVFKKLYADYKQARANLVNLLLTQKGERLMLPEFGSNLLEIIFQPNTDNIKEQIQNTIFEAVQRWLPYISISVTVTTASDDPSLISDVNVKIDGSINNFKIDRIEIFASENSGLTLK